MTMKEFNIDGFDVEAVETSPLNYSEKQKQMQVISFRDPTTVGLKIKSQKPKIH